MSTTEVKICIIGGSGLQNPDFLQDAKEIKVTTPYGDPSDSFLLGKIGNIQCYVLKRHGPNHIYSPTNINYRANIWAISSLGVTHIIATTACGSLKEELKPGDIVFLDQFIDRTTKRETTFYDGKEGSPKGVCHIPLAQPFCQKTTEILMSVAENLRITHHKCGCVITDEGPRFTTKAENLMFQKWGGDVINMTSFPEVVLANELGICYSSIAMVTDYGSWRDSEEEVTVDIVMRRINDIVIKAGKIITNSLDIILKQDWTDVINKKKEMAKSAVM